MNTQTNRPIESSLPYAREVEVLEALEAEPVPGRAAQQIVNAEERPDQRSEDDHSERAEQEKGELALSSRLAPGDHRRQEDAGRDERGGNPEDRQLHVPGAHQVEGEDLGKVDAEEARQLRPIVLRGGPDERLDHEQGRHHEEEPGAGALGRGERHVAGGPERQRGLFATVPAEDVPAPEGREQEADSAQKGDQGQDRPHDHVGGGLVVDARLRRPVVRVGVVVTRSLGRARPGGPAEERGQRLEVPTVGDGVGTQPVLGGRLREEARVVPDQAAVRLGLWTGELEYAAALVVAVCAEVLDRAPSRRVGALSAVASRDVVGRPAQVVGRVVRPEVGAVPENRAVLHQAVVQEHLLPALHVALGVEHPAGGIDDALGDRRLGLVGAVGEQPEYEEPEQHHQDHGLHPTLGNEQNPPLSGQALLSSVALRKRAAI
jgi:hypothetical protein